MKTFIEEAFLQDFKSKLLQRIKSERSYRNIKVNMLIEIIALAP